MFHKSTQKEHWLYRSGEEVQKLRAAANRTYCEKVNKTCDFGGGFYYTVSPQHARAAAEKGVQMLSDTEEQLLCQYFIKKLLEFCNVFEPRVPRSAVVSVYQLGSIMQTHTAARGI